MTELNELELTNVSGGQYNGPVFRYTINWGDTLSGIAVKYKTTVAVLMELNPNEIKNPDKIYAGHTILVPYTK
ncbi:MAG: LysM domain-containing protein [Eubacteriales bacterium]|nr:LysM domain-containing protein [Eubacteriales bacterium]